MILKNDQERAEIYRLPSVDRSLVFMKSPRADDSSDIRAIRGVCQSVLSLADDTESALNDQRLGPLARAERIRGAAKAAGDVWQKQIDRVKAMADGYDATEATLTSAP